MYVGRTNYGRRLKSPASRKKRGIAFADEESTELSSPRARASFHAVTQVRSFTYYTRLAEGHRSHADAEMQKSSGRENDTPGRLDTTSPSCSSSQVARLHRRPFVIFQNLLYRHVRPSVLLSLASSFTAVISPNKYRRSGPTIYI